MASYRDRLIHPIRGLLLCLAGGFFCSWIQTPLPWMIGPLLAMVAGKVGGIGVDAPQGGRQTGQLIIGCALGLYFTPVVVSILAVHAVTMLLAAVFAILLSYICGFSLSRFSGVDKTTAFFASVPGGAAEMAVLGDRFGAAMDKVALAQSLRILLVVVLIPAVLTYSGAHGADQYQPSPGQVSYPGLALLLTLCAFAGGLLELAKIPNAWMLGPLFASITVTVMQADLSAMPVPLSNLGQLLIGCVLGARFERGFMLKARRYLLGLLLSIGIALILSALFALVLTFFTGIPIPTLILATAPGGIAEMGITAKVLQLGVPLVTAFHVTRVVLLVTATGPLFKVMQRISANLKHKGSGTD